MMGFSERPSLALRLLLLLGAVCVSSSRVPTDIRAKLRDTPLARGYSSDLSERQAAISDGDDGPTIIAVPDATKTPLSCFQVAPPVLGPSGPVYQSLDGHVSNRTAAGDEVTPKSPCTKVLMNYSFSQSYGRPFVGRNSNSRSK
jgi:hypothetical protein